MIYLHTGDSKNEQYSVKFRIYDKMLKIDILNQETKEIFEIEKDVSNEQYNTFMLAETKTKIEMIEVFRYTHSNRGTFDDLCSIFGAKALAVIKIGKVKNSEYDTLIELCSLNRKNIEIETIFPVLEKKVKTGKNGRFLKEDRLFLFPSYSISMNDKEYMFDDHGNTKNKDYTNVVEYSKNYVDIKIKKYNLDFSSLCCDDDDNEKIYIESTCGLLNAQMVHLKNGEAAVRLYPFEHEGPFTIKLGWRWYRVRNQYDLILKKTTI